MTVASRGRPVARLTWLSLALAAFMMALVQPVHAGSVTDPEITDPLNDQRTTPGNQATCPSATTQVNTCFSNADILAAWVDGETATEIQLNILIAGTGAPATLGTAYKWDFQLTVGGTTYTASTRQTGSTSGGNVGPFTGTNTPEGVATSTRIENSIITMVVPLANLGNPTPGTVFTQLFADSEAYLAGATSAVLTDRAPNDAAFGRDYVLGGSGAGNATAGDSDNDGLNDTCEQDFYGGLNGTNNATNDDDGDGLSNQQECAANPRTDPTNPDTDGDGVHDGDDPFPTDPSQGGTSSSSSASASGSGSGSRSSTSDTGTVSDSRSSTGSGTQDEAAGEVQDFGDAVEKLQSDLDYLGTSAGGMVAVLILAILALAVRWSL